jgi:2'-5' RNA ligase
MRAFFCLPVDASVRAVVGRAADRLRRETRMSATWVDPANYHVTLRFLCDIDPALTVELKELAARVAAACPTFSLKLAALGAFPSLERARVLWVGSEAPVAFGALVASLERGLTDLGFAREPKTAVAHVTIARMKGSPDRDLAEVVASIGALDVPECVPKSILLMESELTPRGARYTPLFAAPLGRQEGAR